MNAAPSIECPACGLAVPFGTAICPEDGTPLVVQQKGGQGLPTPPRPVAQGSAAMAVEPSIIIEDPQALKPGDPLIGVMLGEYRVEERIGLGGMGLVYRGVHPMIGKSVAIKVLRPEICDSASHVERLLAEARAVNAIRHRGIVDIFSFGKTADGRQYLVMEFLDGVALDTHIANRGVLAPNEAVQILEEIAAALAAAHGAGIIHRDLKPNNIYLVKQGYGQPYVKLLDFGLAKQGLPPGGTTPQTHFGLVVGTPEYMAPEQARGENVGPKTDLYALGVVAFQMLTGHLPFEANSPMEFVVKHLEHAPPQVIDDQPDVPKDLSDLVGKLLAKSPEDRPHSAEEVRRSVRRIARAMPQEVTNVATLTPRPPPLKEHPAPGSAPTPQAEPGTDPASSPAGRAVVMTPTPMNGLPAVSPRDEAVDRTEVDRTEINRRPRTGSTTIVTLTPRARWIVSVAAMMVVFAILGVGLGMALRGRFGPAPVVEQPVQVAAPVPPVVSNPPPQLPPPPQQVQPAQPPPAVAVVPAPAEVKDPPLPVEVKPEVKPKDPAASKVRQGKPPRPAGQQVTLERVVARIESLKKRYAETPGYNKILAVPLDTKMSDALRASPEELRNIWVWLDKWEREVLPR